MSDTKYNIKHPALPSNLRVSLRILVDEAASEAVRNNFAGLEPYDMPLFPSRRLNVIFDISEGTECGEGVLQLIKRAQAFNL